MQETLFEAETEIKIDAFLNTEDDAGTLIAQYAEKPLVGKKLIDVPCPNCGIAGHLWITQQDIIEGDKSVVTVQCKNCDKASRLEIEVPEEPEFNPDDLIEEEPEEDAEDDGFGGRF